MKKITLAILLAGSLVACKKEEKKSESEFKGATVQVHGGQAFTVYRIDEQGKPKEISVAMNDALFNSLTTNPGSGDHSMHDNMFSLPLHPKAKEGTPFQFVMLNWNPDGHEPLNIYGLPHFDFHFYMTAENEVMNYMDPVKFDNLPAPDYYPAMHIAGGGVPMMGNHLIDLTSPELNGAPFTQTFIYGSYDGKIVFYEPMITKSFLETQTSFSRSIPQPQKFQRTGYFPTRMRTVKHDGLTEVILDQFVMRTAS